MRLFLKKRFRIKSLQELPKLAPEATLLAAMLLYPGLWKQIAEKAERTKVTSSG